MKYYVGCSVWNNQTWVKDFYPATLEPENYLEYYSNIYDFAEVALSSVRVSSKFLNKFIFRKWTKNSHDNFRFTLKVPGEINNNDNGIGLGNL